MVKRMGSGSRTGQILVVVLLLMMVLSVMVPLMVTYVQNEAKWTNKEGRNTQAFHLAEAGTEKALLELSLSTQTWNQIQKCTFSTPNNPCSPANFAFDQSYTDVSGGEYAIYITSGPPGTSQQAQVFAVARDANHQETRSLKVIYSNGTLGNVAILGGKGVQVSGNNLTVEWGAIESPNPIVSNGDAHPNLYSAASISGITGAPPGATSAITLPHCDSPNCWWWHSFDNQIPPLPVIDFNFYRSSAQALGAAGQTACGNGTSYYQGGNFSGQCSDLKGNPFFVEGSWTNMDGPYNGTIIVMGSLDTGNGKMTAPSNGQMSIPQQAWIQYCNDWSFYCSTYTGGTTGDTSTCAAPHTAAGQCWGKNSTYLSPSNAVYTDGFGAPVITGLLYVGSDFTGPQGGGNSNLGYGIIYVNGTVNLNSNSHAKWFYDGGAGGAGIQTTQIFLVRTWWQDVKVSWPNLP